MHAGYYCIGTPCQMLGMMACIDPTYKWSGVDDCFLYVAYLLHLSMHLDLVEFKARGDPFTHSKDLQYC